MRVAVSSTGKEMDSAVDQRFGRAEYLLIVDTESEDIVQVIDNQAAKNVAHGAGISAATLIAQAGAQAVLTGYMGPKAVAVCEKAGIIIFNGAAGTVREAVHRFINTPRAQQGAARPANQRESAAAQTQRQRHGTGQRHGWGTPPGAMRQPGKKPTGQMRRQW
jgi:predicted Fe-Mo cluster-binding NifX family protein